MPNSCGQPQTDTMRIGVKARYHTKKEADEKEAKIIITIKMVRCITIVIISIRYVIPFECVYLNFTVHHWIVLFHPLCSLLDFISVWRWLYFLFISFSPSLSLTHFLDSYNKCLCLQMQNYKIMGNLFLMHIVRLLFFCSFLFGMRCRLVLRHYFSCSKWYKKKWFWFELVHSDISLACWNDFRLALDCPLVRPHHTQI